MVLSFPIWLSVLQVQILQFRVCFQFHSWCSLSQEFEFQLCLDFLFHDFFSVFCLIFILLCVFSEINWQFSNAKMSSAAEKNKCTSGATPCLKLLLLQYWVPVSFMKNSAGWNTFLFKTGLHLATFGVVLDSEASHFRVECTKFPSNSKGRCCLMQSSSPGLPCGA